MKKLKTFKSKTSSPDTGLFSKLTKRYTNAVSARLRRSQSPQDTAIRSRSPQKHIITGSYDMDGNHSDDHRVEIGAPVLISKTNLDVDRLDSDGQIVRIPSTATSSNESENDIFADAISSFSPNMQNIKFEFLSPEDKENSPDFTSNQIQQVKSVHSDCSSSMKSFEATPTNKPSTNLDTNKNENNSKNKKHMSKSAQNLHKSEIRLILENTPSRHDLKFTTADLHHCFDLPIRQDSPTNNTDDKQNPNDSEEFVSPPSSPMNSSSISPITTSSSPTKCNSSVLSSEINDSPTTSSKSIVVLKPPFIENPICVNNQINSTTISEEHYYSNAESYYKTPTELKPISNVNISPCNIKPTQSKSPIPPPLPPIDIEVDDVFEVNNDKNIELVEAVNISNSFDLIRTIENEPVPQKRLNKKFSNSEPNTPMQPEKTDFKIYHFKSVESLSQKQNQNKFTYRHSNNSNSVQNLKNNDIETSNQTGSQANLDLSDFLNDFDLKSVSLQSLNAKNLFLSIEELNEITKEIEESEEFNNEIDLEYCEHRDNLKPNERRITLLKNKNSRLISLHRNKEKLNNAWTGLKHWIGEEKGKIKEVVQKHAALQRVGATKESSVNLSSQSQTCSRGTSVDRNPQGLSNFTSSTTSVNRTESTNPTIIGEDITDAIGDESESVFTLSGGDRNRTNSTEKTDSVLHLKNISKTKEPWQGQNGFEELRRYIKQGGDFGKDLVNILQERIDAEQIYSKSLSKMANKLNKACRDVPGTIVDAWRSVATEMESRSEVHRQLSNSLSEEIVKPLKSLLEAHHKTRKTVESNVDKASRILSEWRLSESKAKKVSHTAARENEKLQDAMLDVRIQKSPSIALLHQQNSKEKNVSEKEIKNAEKDCAKLDNKRRKAEEAVKRADVEYYTLCIRAERARVDWEMSVLRGSTVLQNLEMQRLSSMKQFISNYARLTSDINPIMEELCQRLIPQIEACNVQKDLAVVKNIRRAAEGPSEQLLPDFYCEHTTLAMNRERRKHALIKLLQLVKTDLDRERRSRNGLKGLSQTMINQDNQNITDKLYHIRSMLTYLEGSRFKLQSALLELDHKPRSTHPLAPHIQITRDRTGLQQSILKVPIWLKNDDKMGSNEEETNNILNETSRDSESTSNCIDIKNDMLVKNFNRSKSTTDILLNGNQNLTDNHHNKVSKTNTLTTITDINNDSDSPNFDRGIADGGSNQHDSDFDEFSSQDDDDEIRRSSDKLNGYMGGSEVDRSSSNNNNNYETKYSNNNNLGNSKNSKTIVISRCKALYSYTPKLYDELELTPGDIIEVHIKQDDGWWLGALGEQVGIFPATYVEEIA